MVIALSKSSKQIVEIEEMSIIRWLDEKDLVTERTYVKRGDGKIGFKLSGAEKGRTMTLYNVDHSFFKIGHDSVNLYFQKENEKKPGNIEYRNMNQKYTHHKIKSSKRLFTLLLKMGYKAATFYEFSIMEDHPNTFYTPKVGI